MVNELNKLTINDSIPFIQDTISEDKQAGMNLMQFAKTIYDNGGIQCYRVKMIINTSTFVAILSNVKNQKNRI